MAHPQGAGKMFLSRIIEKHPIIGIMLRNDNGSQFVAQLVGDYLKEMHVDQNLIQVATPEETHSLNLILES
jgi:putative transposase